MTGALTRRAVIAGGLSAALAPRASAQVPYPLSQETMEDLLEIDEDENAVMDALTYMLWRAPAMKGMVNKVSFGPMHEETPYKVWHSGFAPYSFEAPTTPPYSDFNDKLAVLFATKVAATLDAFAVQINSLAVDQGIAKLTTSAEAQFLSNDTYENLLWATVPALKRTAIPFGRYLPPDYGWGPKLAALMLERNSKFFTAVSLFPTERGRQVARLGLHKLKLLAPAMVPDVVKRWGAPDLQGTVFPLAAQDPWPPNYYVKLAGLENPLQSIVSRAASASRIGSHRKCQGLNAGGIPVTSCSDEDYGIYGETVWDMLRDHASPAGLILWGNLFYPEGVQ
jgi:hypothetical protein